MRTLVAAITMAQLGWLVPVEAEDNPATPPPPQAETQTVTLESLQRQNDELRERLETLETEAVQSTAKEEMKLRIYGFTDVTYRHIFLEKDNFYRDLVGGYNGTFTVWHLNIFFDRKLTERFRAQAEIRFTYLPTGDETIGMTPGDYQVFDNETYDPIDGRVLRWGGIEIQRAFIEYRHADWLTLKAGHFLSPYGIWNVDHGAPALIPARQPYLVIEEYVPMSQLGLLLEGRIFLTDSYWLEYGLTLSNGRNRAFTVTDLDGNKALGARLQLSGSGAVQWTTGLYLYTGEVSDVVKYVKSVDPFLITAEHTTWYREDALAFNLQLSWKGLHLQAESVFGRIRYKQGHHAVLDGGVIDASHGEYVSYLLLAYRLPFSTVELRPYFMMEVSQSNRFKDDTKALLYTGGLNWRINPYVVLKAEFSAVTFPEVDSVIEHDFQVASVQLAASF